MSENPIGLDGMEFIEFASPRVKILEDLMERSGMRLISQHKSKKMRLFRQGQINFIINEDSGSFASEFATLHGPSVCSTGFRVKDAQLAFAEAVKRGARPFGDDAKKSGWGLPAIYGIGNSLIYFVDQYGAKGDIYGSRFEPLKEDRPAGHGMTVIDHMTNNVPVGEMQKWCDFYSNVFGFKEKRYFDIKGKTTGLISKVMVSPCGKICIPINEPTDPKSQIQEYLDEYKGSGIQHIALLTGDIASTVVSLRKSGIDFLAAPPNTYYESVPKRLPLVQENLKVLQDLGILVDGDEKGYLLQIFTKNQVGPIFLEVIQRRGHDGFGEGNFQALFDSIEEDQRRRGVL